MVCTNCNNQNPGGLVYCIHCKNKIIDTPENPAGIEWVDIPGAVSDPQFLPVRNPFRISKYPVTNAQYREFLRAKPKHPVPDHWDAATRQYPEGKANHPVVLVTHFDAVDFCKWAHCRLPSVYQWMTAGFAVDRTKTARHYPWGNDWEDGRYCNSKEAGFEDTTPVDQYPEGVSPYGVWDLYGNVREFCSDTIGNYDGKALLGDCFWDEKMHLLFFACKASPYPPGNNGPTIGFRVIK